MSLGIHTIGYSSPTSPIPTHTHPFQKISHSSYCHTFVILIIFKSNRLKRREREREKKKKKKCHGYSVQVAR